MKGLSARLFRLIPRLLPAITILFLLSSVTAQQGEAPTGAGRPSPSGGSVPESARQPSIRERQYKLIEMEREAAKARTPEEEKLALAQIAEDFEKLQVINNRMMGATMRAVEPDYPRIADTTAEIKMRANRMKVNLRLPTVDEKKGEKAAGYKKAQDAGELKANLLSLDGSIMRFIKNPIFKNPAVVEVEQAAKASRDLETVIELSQMISKDAQRLSKPSAKNP